MLVNWVDLDEGGRRALEKSLVCVKESWEKFSNLKRITTKQEEEDGWREWRWCYIEKMCLVKFVSRGGGIGGNRSISK